MDLLNTKTDMFDSLMGSSRVLPLRIKVDLEVMRWRITLRAPDLLELRLWI